MDARSPQRATNWPTRNLAPAQPLDDVELVQFSSDATFRAARGDWLRDISRQGDPAFANMFTACWVLSGYMGFKKGAVAFPDQHQLAADLGWGVATVRRALDLAVAWGWLAKVRRPLSTNIYRMSFSRSVRETIELGHTNRIADFKVEAAKKRIARDGLRSIRPDQQVQSDLSARFDQVRSNGSLRSDRLSSSISSSDDPLHQSTERLGEGELDHTLDEAEQKKASLDEVISVLGRGDMAVGRRIAGGMAPARLAYLVSLAEEDGMVAAAPAIIEARNGVSPYP